MLRGFRWQLVALLTAAIVFVIAIVARITDNPTPTLPTPDAGTTATPVVNIEVSPTAIPMIASNVMVTTETAPTDNVVTYREALVGDVRRLNPLLASLNPPERDITSLIFEGLIRTNQYGEPEADLADSWVISSDGLEYTILLRDDVLWQDGIPFTADDVVYTMSIVRSPDFPGPAALSAFWRTVETEKLDDHLVRFRLTQPLGSFLDMLRIGILPDHALRGTTAAQLATHPFNLTPIGTGPYQLEALRVDENQRIRTIDLRVAPVYRQRPEGQTGYALDRVSFRLYDDFDSAVQGLAAGDVDALASRSRTERGALLSVPNVVPATQIEAVMGTILFNWQGEESDFFQEQRVRVALEVGLDRSSLVERTLMNQAVRADSPILPGSWAYLADLDWPQQSPDTARQMLATAYERVQEDLADDEGEAEGDTAETGEEGGEETDTEATMEAASESTFLFAFDILSPDDPDLIDMLEEVATQWSQYGVQVTVVPADDDTFRSRLESGDFDAALVELSLGDSADPDVYQFWHQGQLPPDGKNYGAASDRRISELLERARVDTSGVNRVQFYHDFQREFVERAIAIPLYYPLYTYATASRVDGVQLGFIGTPADRFRNIADWTIAGS